MSRAQYIKSLTEIQESYKKAIELGWLEEAEACKRLFDKLFNEFHYND